MPEMLTIFDAVEEEMEPVRSDALVEGQRDFGIAFLTDQDSPARKSGTRRLPAQAVDVWAFDVEGAAELHLLRCMGTLSSDELKRSEQFDSRQNRERFIIGRGTIRRILARYFGERPSSIAISRGEYGKPIMDPSYGIHANWSHSGTCWMLAIAASGPVGIDVEQCDRCSDWSGPAEIACHTSELAYIAEATDGRRFYDIWTRKEALFKATGKGLHDSMNETSVIGADGALLNPICLPAGKWWLTSLPVEQPLVAAIATGFATSSIRLLVDRRSRQFPLDGASPSRLGSSQDKRREVQ